MGSRQSPCVMFREVSRLCAWVMTVARPNAWLFRTFPPQHRLLYKVTHVQPFIGWCARALLEDSGTVSLGVSHLFPLWSVPITVFSTMLNPELCHHVGLGPERCHHAGLDCSIKFSDSLTEVMKIAQVRRMIQRGLSGENLFLPWLK